MWCITHASVIKHQLTQYSTYTSPPSWQTPCQLPPQGALGSRKPLAAGFHRTGSCPVQTWLPSQRHTWVELGLLPASDLQRSKGNPSRSKALCQQCLRPEEESQEAQSGVPADLGLNLKSVPMKRWTLIKSLGPSEPNGPHLLSRDDSDEMLGRSPPLWGPGVLNCKRQARGEAAFDLSGLREERGKGWGWPGGLEGPPKSS